MGLSHSDLTWFWLCPSNFSRTNTFDPGVTDKLQSTECWVKKVLKDLQKTKCLKPRD